MVKNTLYKITPSFLKDLYHRIKVAIKINDYYVLPKKDMTYAEDLLYTQNNADFLHDWKFIRAWQTVRTIGTGMKIDSGYSWRWRFYVILWAALHAEHLDGDFVECGANTGCNSAGVMEYLDFQHNPKTFYLLDTFKGMDPKYSTKEEMARHEKLGYGKNGSLLERVRDTFKEYKNVVVVPGPVPETLYKVTSQKIAYLSIDMNSVKPEVEALEYFWPRMVSGGIIVFDDYGYPGCEEQKKAHDEFAFRKGVTVLSLPTCQGIIIKP